MSLHPSLRGARGKSGSQRNVLKRHERLRYLIARGLWVEDRSVFGLPKIKPEKVKARKAAAKEAAPAKGAATAETPAAPAKPAAKSAAKPAK